MKIRFVLLAAFAVSLATLSAAVPPPEKLLPADTVAVVTVPDWDKTVVFWNGSASGRFWDDPVMKAFRDKFEKRFREEVVEPWERDLGVKLADVAGLARGQLTLGVVKGGEKPDDLRAIILLDAKDKKDALAAKLAELKKKWVDAGKELKTEKVRDVEFTTLLWQGTNKTPFSLKLGGEKPSGAGGGDGDAADLKQQTDAKPKKSEITLGMSDSLLLVGSSAKEFEKVLVRLSGGSVPALAEVPEFEANAAAMFRDARAYAWINAKLFIDLILKRTDAGNDAPNRAANPFAPDPSKVLDALGLTGLKTIAAHLSDTGDGALFNVFFGAPESARKGIFKVLIGEAKDSSPPPFVPANATKFTRWRADGKKLWATIETALSDISPPLAGMVQMTIEAAGKDKDPGFDLKKALIGNLGDDIISYEKPPRGTTLAALNSPPTLYLVGSPNAEGMAQGMKGLMAVFNPLGEVKDREFLGRKVFTVKMAPTRTPQGVVERSLHFSNGSGYLALSSDEATLEEFLRSADKGGRALRETAGLGDAAQRIGGMGTGWFTYENQTETIRVFFEAVKKDPGALEKMFSNPLTSALPGATRPGQPGAAQKGLKDWFDFSLLPPFEQVAKYFHFAVSTGSGQGDGISLKTLLPSPPQLKK